MNKTIQMYDPKREFSQHEGEIRKAIDGVLSHGLFINGPEVALLETQLTEYIGKPNLRCITTSNGTDALKIALLALGIGPGDEVITVAHSWISTAEVIPLVGARPVFVDIEESTFCIDPLRVKDAITPKTKAIIVVSLYGYLPDLESLSEVVGDIPIIEDAAQSFGAVRQDEKSCDCCYAKIATTSFFPSKPLGCYGDGGAIFTRDVELADKIRAIKNHGGVRRFHHVYIGLNARLDTMQAAILLAKLKWFEATLEARRSVAHRYIEGLADLHALGCIKLPMTERGVNSAWAQFSILARNQRERDAVVDFLKENGVNVAIFYPAALHLQPCFAYLGGVEGDLPVTEKICDRVFNLPCYGEISPEEQTYIIELLYHFYNNGKYAAPTNQEDK